MQNPVPQNGLQVSRLTRQNERVVDLSHSPEMASVVSPWEQMNPEEYKEFQISMIAEKFGMLGGSTGPGLFDEMFSERVTLDDPRANPPKREFTEDMFYGSVYSPPRRIGVDFIIYNLITGTKIDMVVMPDEITDNSGASFSPQNPIGRTVPFWGYSASGPRKIGFNVLLHDDMLQGKLVQVVHQLYALQYPVYRGSRIDPPKCMLIIGSIVRMTVIPESVNVTWQKPVRNQKYVSAQVSFQFSESDDHTPFDASDIEKLGTNPDYKPALQMSGSIGSELEVQANIAYYSQVMERKGVVLKKEEGIPVKDKSFTPAAAAPAREEPSPNGHPKDIENYKGLVILVVKNSFMMYVFENGRLIKQYRVALGRNNGKNDTPCGEYRMTSRSVNPTYSGSHGVAGPYIRDPRNPLGTRWHAISFVKNWSVNDPANRTASGLGIHGTNEPDKFKLPNRYLGEGCVRMMNPDVQELSDTIIQRFALSRIKVYVISKADQYINTVAAGAGS